MARAVEKLDLEGGVRGGDAQRTVPRALGRAEADDEFGAVDLKAEREQLEELDALVVAELGALLERERAEFFVRDVDLAVTESHGKRARRAGSAKVDEVGDGADVERADEACVRAPDSERVDAVGLFGGAEAGTRLDRRKGGGGDRTGRGGVDEVDVLRVTGQPGGPPS